jgi:hypothetical protein
MIARLNTLTLNSASNTDRWSECQEEILESDFHFTDFIHVPRFRDGCSKFVRQVRNFPLLMLSRLSSDKLEDQNRRSLPQSALNPTESPCCLVCTYIQSTPASAPIVGSVNYTL